MRGIPAIEGGSRLIDREIKIGPLIEEDDIAGVVEVLKSRRLASTVGTVTRVFEEEFAKKIGVKNAIAVCNGSAALFVALKAAGIGPGDEVIVPSFTFVATATAVLHANALPVFADIDEKTFTISPESLEEKITERTKAVIVVHLFGHPADMDKIMKIARKHGIMVIEDSAQAIGAMYRGKFTGSLGDIGAFSFYPTKNITSGEGGMVTTNIDEIAERARLIINHGQTDRYYHEILGYNLRMTELQAALGLSQLRKLDRFNEIRRKHARIYSEALGFLEEEGLIRLPREYGDVCSSWSLYEVLINNAELRVGRDIIYNALRAEGAPATIAYPRVLYENPLFKELRGHGKGCPWRCPLNKYYTAPKFREGLTPIAENVARRCLTLHTDPIMGEDGVKLVAKAFIKILKYYQHTK